MSGSWSNTETNLIVLIEQVSGYSGIFGYSPAPALNDLVFSLAAAAGTDPYGNAYVSGLGVYNAGQLVARVDPVGGVTTYSSSAYVSMSPAAGLFFGDYNPNTGTLLPSGAQLTETPDVGLPWNQGTLDLYSPNGAGLDQLVHRLWSGYTGQTTGSARAPHLLTLDSAGSSQADHLLSGSIIKTNLAGTPYTWQTPVFGADWASGDFNGAFGGLQYSLDGFDNLVALGAVHMTLAAGLAAGTYALNSTALVAPYLPKKSWCVTADHTSSGNVYKATAQFRITTTGLLEVATGSAIAQNDNFYLNATVPLGNKA